MNRNHPTPSPRHPGQDARRDSSKRALRKTDPDRRWDEQKGRK